MKRLFLLSILYIGIHSSSMYAMMPDESNAHRVAAELVTFLAQREIPKSVVTSHTVDSKKLSALHKEIETQEQVLSNYQEYRKQLQHRLEQLNRELQSIQNLSSPENAPLLEALTQAIEAQERIDKAYTTQSTSIQDLRQKYEKLKKWYSEKADLVLVRNQHNVPLYAPLSKSFTTFLESLSNTRYTLVLIKTFLPEETSYKQLLKKSLFGIALIEHIARALSLSALDVILSLASGQSLKLVDMSLDTQDTKEKAAVIKWLLQRPSSSTAGIRLLREALMQEDATLVKLLLDTGINPNICNDPYDGTLLLTFINHADAKKYHIESYKTILKLLLDAGIDPNARDQQGRTPLTLASRIGFTPAVQILLEYKASIDLQDGNSMTALLYAASNEHLECIKLLLAAGADPFLANAWGHTPSSIARTLEAAQLIQDHIKKNSTECPLCCIDTYNAHLQPLECGHLYCCNTCLLQLINISIKDHDPLGNLVCKLKGCYKPFTQKDISRVLTNKVRLALLEDITQEQTIMRDPHGRHCPTPDCTFAYIHDKETRKTIHCPKCKQSHCSQCFKAHGASLSCNEFTKQEAREKELLDKWKQTADARPCPKCNTAIEKNGGCPHMTCSKCRYEFCWDCMGRYGNCQCIKRW